MVAAVELKDAQARQRKAQEQELAFRKASERLVLDLLHVNDISMVSKGTMCKLVYRLYADNDVLVRALFKAAPNHERFANITPEHRAILEGKEPAADVV